jgi:hypothetical protein
MSDVKTVGAPTLYAVFPSGEVAQRAYGALLDRGVHKEDISVIAPVAHDGHVPEAARLVIGTPTRSDVAIRAAKGAGFGVAVGAAAALAAMFVPGIGLVLGAGALATALGATAGTIAGGAAIGAVVGYMMDQGVPAEIAARYKDSLRTGGAMLAVTVPYGDADQAAIEDALVKYDATDINLY